MGFWVWGPFTLKRKKVCYSEEWNRAKTIGCCFASFCFYSTLVMCQEVGICMCKSSACTSQLPLCLLSFQVEVHEAPHAGAISGARTCELVLTTCKWSKCAHTKRTPSSLPWFRGVPFSKQVCCISVTTQSFTAAGLVQYHGPEYCCSMLDIPHLPQSRGLTAFKTAHILYKLFHWEENYVFCNASGQWAKGTIEYELGVKAGALQCSALCVF